MPTVLPLILTLALQATPELSQRFESLVRDAPGRIGARAELIETAESAGLHDEERFPMQSVYKLPIAMAVLDQVERRTLTLTQKIYIGPKDLVPSGAHSPIRDAHPQGGIEMSLQELIRAAIVDSDGTASDVLFHVGGGASRLTAYLRGIGIRNITIATTEAQMASDPMAQYRNYATPRDAVLLLRAIDAGRGVSPAARTMLLDYMTQTPVGPRRLRGLLPSGTMVAHKTGTDGTKNGLTRATNDIGIVTLPDGRHVAIALFVKDSTATAEVREGSIAKIARAAWDHWTGGSSK